MNVRRMMFGVALVSASLALPLLAARAAEGDIKRLAPTDAHTIVYAKPNPERDYQDEYLADAWKTFQDEKICEKVFELISSRAPAEELDKVKDAWKEIQTALEPINLEALKDGKEFVLANTMIGPFGHVLLAVRLTDEDAEELPQRRGQFVRGVSEMVGRQGDGRDNRCRRDQGHAFKAARKGPLSARRGVRRRSVHRVLERRAAVAHA